MRIIPAKEPVYVVCNNGVFVLPEHVYTSLANQVVKQFVYLREDEDTLTIATTRLPGGRKRQLNTYYRSPLFRTATKLAIVDLPGGLQIMAVEWR